MASAIKSATQRMLPCASASRGRPRCHGQYNGQFRAQSWQCPAVLHQAAPVPGPGPAPAGPAPKDIDYFNIVQRTVTIVSAVCLVVILTQFIFLLAKSPALWTKFLKVDSISDSKLVFSFVCTILGATSDKFKRLLDLPDKVDQLTIDVGQLQTDVRKLENIVKKVQCDVELLSRPWWRRAWQ